MAIYYVELSTSIVDGSRYTSDDTIIIRAGARGNLLFKNFNGNGKYITITNENTTPSKKVEITSGSVGETWTTLELRDCKYVDLRGDNDPDIEYGIKVIYDGTPVMNSVVWVRQESDHIKISYLELDDTAHTATGLMIHDGTLSEAWIFDTFEIHHNYIHDTGYSGMYLGHNNPPTEFDPYSANYSVHHNLLVDMGAYGITLKGIHTDSGVNYIYNNTVIPSDRSATGGNSTGIVFESDGAFHHGIGVQYFYGSTYANIYNNWVEKTRGAGFKIGDQNHNVYNNTIVGCGVNNSVLWGHGIVTYNHAGGVNIYDNTIIQPTRYGVYARSGTNTGGATMSRNLIGDAGQGEWDEEVPNDLIESSGEDANVYHANVADFGFRRWSDDGDYSNDDFSLDGDLCEGVECEDVCIGNDLYSRKCDPITGNCVTDALIEANSPLCIISDPCEGITCSDVCIGNDLYSRKCIDGKCVTDQLLESDSLDCKLPTDEETIMKYITLGGLGLVAYIMLKMNKK